MKVLDEWLRERRGHEWCTVAQHHITKHDGGKLDLFTTSVLTPKGSEELVLKRWSWLADQEFGQSVIGRDLKDGSLMMYEETSKNVGQKNEVTVEPFTFTRRWGDTWPTRFEIIQNFILFYNLYPDKDCYKAVSDSGEVIDVVRISNEREKQWIKIRTNFLQNYLAFKDRVLVRQFDNRVSQDGKTPSWSVSDDCRDTLTSDDYVFLKVVYDNDSGGILQGKDVIRPTVKREDLLGWPKKQCDFIIGINKSGKNKLATYNKNDGPTKFLAPVYFRHEVLQKYNDDPKYDVSAAMVSCGAHWGVPIKTDRAGLLWVHLGDIAEHMPYNEQRHWKRYNIVGGNHERELH